jgi:hypothetical protein
MPEGLVESGRRGSFTQATHETLYAYYYNGGRKNFETSFASWRATISPRPGEIAPPIIIPKRGFTIRTCPASERFGFRLSSGKGAGVDPACPVVGLVFPRALLVNGQTGLLDEMNPPG